VFAAEFGSRPAACFTPDCGSAAFLAETLSALGVPSEYVAGQGGEWGMNRVLATSARERFEHGEYQCIVCCDLLKEGWDSPRIEAVGVARPTLQNGTYTQMVGRGTRQSFDTGKYDLLVVDLDYLADADVKDLCSPIDLFDDGSVDPEIMATARQIARERAVTFDPKDVLDEAEKICSTRRKFCVRLTGKEPEYAAYELTPIGISKILDLGLKKKSDFDTNPFRPNPASQAQLMKLHSIGVRTPDGLSKWGASKMIRTLEKRREMGLATPGQVQAMMIHGVPPDIARALKGEDASAAITQLSSVKQLELFE
jgi:superfamily II DNA/RNA helicase